MEQIKIDISKLHNPWQKWHWELKIVALTNKFQAEKAAQNSQHHSSLFDSYAASENRFSFSFKINLWDPKLIQMNIDTKLIQKLFLNLPVPKKLLTPGLRESRQSAGAVAAPCGWAGAPNCLPGPPQHRAPHARSPRWWPVSPGPAGALAGAVPPRSGRAEPCAPVPWCCCLWRGLLCHRWLSDVPGY